VNDRENTVSLVLEGCRGILGLGLAPLENWRALESIDLLGTGADEEPAPFLAILNSMIPHNLFDVRLRQVSEQTTSGYLPYFMWNLRNAKQKQMIETRALCSACNLPVMEQSRQMVPSFVGKPTMCCVGCKKNFCQRPSCPMAVFECACACLSCVDCDIAAQCHGCRRTIFGDCSPSLQCDKCEKTFCDDCDGIFSCDLCSGGYTCQDCGTLPSEICENNCKFCSDCQDEARCAHCNSQFCVECKVGIRQCQLCTNCYCNDPACLDRIEFCFICQADTCKDCREMEHCAACNNSFCKNHTYLVDCESCNTRHCRGCALCSLCEKGVCFLGCSCSMEEKSTKRAKLS